MKNSERGKKMWDEKKSVIPCLGNHYNMLASKALSATHIFHRCRKEALVVRTAAGRSSLIRRSVDRIRRHVEVFGGTEPHEHEMTGQLVWWKEMFTSIVH